MSVLIASCLLAFTEGRNYIDDFGIVHSSTKNKPKIVLFARQAISLRNYGLTTSQLVGVFGEWYISGSDTNWTVGSSLPANPDNDDIQFLQEVVDLSPSCHVGYCTEFDEDAFMAMTEVDEVLVHGYLGSFWGLGNEQFRNKVVEKTGKPPIFFEMSKEGSDMCELDPSGPDSTCPGLSMIDLIEKNFELAEYFDFDIPDSINSDRQTLCSSAANFQTNMKTAHENGVRLMAAYLTTGISYFADPTSDGVLRMFEELGMPILHTGKCFNEGICGGNYFWEYMAKETYFQSCPAEGIAAECNDDPFYPVDMWLYDHRTTMMVTEPSFTLDNNFPDKALIAGQRAYWPITGFNSPLDAAEILDIVGPQVASATRLHPATPCTGGINVTGTDHRTQGLPGGEYACFSTTNHNSKYLEKCSFTKSCAAENKNSQYWNGNTKDKNGSLRARKRKCKWLAKQSAFKKRQHCGMTEGFELPWKTIPVARKVCTTTCCDYLS